MVPPCSAPPKMPPPSKQYTQRRKSHLPAPPTASPSAIDNDLSSLPGVGAKDSRTPSPVLGDGVSPPPVPKDTSPAASGGTRLCTACASNSQQGTPSTSFTPVGRSSSARQSRGSVRFADQEATKEETPKPKPLGTSRTWGAGLFRSPAASAESPEPQELSAKFSRWLESKTQRSYKRWVKLNDEREEQQSSAREENAFGTLSPAPSAEPAPSLVQ